MKMAYENSVELSTILRKNVLHNDSSVLVMKIRELPLISVTIFSEYFVPILWLADFYACGVAGDRAGATYVKLANCHLKVSFWYLGIGINAWKLEVVLSRKFLTSCSLEMHDNNFHFRCCF